MSVRTDVVNLNVNINGSKAKDELNQLRKRSSDLAYSLKNELVKGTKEYIAASKELTQVNARMASLRQEIGLTALSQKELTAELNRLKALKNIATPQTKEFFDLQKQIDAVNGRLAQVRSGMFGFKSFLNGISGEIKQFGVLAASYLGFSFLTSQVHNMISGQAKMSDSLAQLKIYLHGTTQDVTDLWNALKQLDTRTSMSTLVDIATIVAKKGVVKSEIAGVTQALDELFTVLGTEIGDPHEAVASLVKLVNVYSEDHHVTAKNISDIGAAIQGLTSSGVATGDFLIGFAERMAGVRGITGITIQSVLGLGAALEELGQRQESAGTAAQKLILQMFLKPAQYAQAAGLTIDEFTKKLSKDPIEALILVAKTLKETGKAPEDLINAFTEMGINGARVIGTLGDIAGNADYMRKRFVDASKAFGDHSALMKAFEEKNITFGASIDRIGKAFNSLTTSTTVKTFFVDAANNVERLIKWLPQAAAFVRENATAFYLWTIAIIANTKAGNLLLQNAVNIWAWLRKTALAFNAMTTEQILNTIATRAQTVASAAFAVVQALVTGNVAKLKIAWQELKLAMGGINPLSIALGIAGALYIAYTQLAHQTSALAEKQKELQEINKSIAKEASSEISQLEILAAKTRDVKLSNDERVAAAKELQRVYPAIFGNLSIEAILAGKVADAYERASRAVLAKAKAAVYTKRLDDNAEKFENASDEIHALAKRYKIKNDQFTFQDDPTGAGLLNPDKAEATGAPAAFVQKVREYNELLQEQGDLTHKIIQYQKEGQAAVADTTVSPTASGGTVAGDRTVAMIKADLLNVKKAILTAKDGERAALLDKEKALKEELAHALGKKSVDDKAAEKAEAKMETIAARLKRLQQEAKRIGEDADAAEESKDAKQQQAVKDRYDKFLEKLDAELHDKKGKLLVNAGEYAAIIAGLSADEQKELNALYQKQFEARSEKEYDQSLQNLKDYYNDRRQAIEEQYAQDLIDKKTYKAQLRQLDADEATDTATVDQDYVGTSKKAAKAVKGGQSAAAKKRIADRDADRDAEQKDKVYLAERAVLVAHKGTDAELEAKKALIQAKFEADTAYLDKSSEAYKTAQAQLNKDLKEADKTYLQEKVAQVGEVLQGINNVYSGFVDVLNQKDQNKLDEEKTQNDQKKKSYQKQLDGKLISQKQYDIAIAKMDDDMAARQADINEKQAQRNKSVALFGAVINAALGITKIWADYADVPYYAAALTAIEVAATAVQIAKIESQPVPKGRKGLVVQGSSHEQNGIDMVDRGTGKTVANIEGGEPVMVLSKNTYSNNRDLVNNLLYNSQNRNGARVMAPWYGAAPTPIASGKLIPLMRTGGIVNNTNGAQSSAGVGTAGAAASEMSGLLQQMILEQQNTQRILSQVNNRPTKAYVVYQDISDSSQLLAKAKSVAGVNQAA